VEQGTKVLTKEGTLAGNINVVPLAETEKPKPPEGGAIIGTVHNFGPDGTKFDKPFTITLAYDEDMIPPGIKESSLAIAFHNGSKWVELTDSKVDTSADTITATANHFTLFAVVSTPPVPVPTPVPATVTPAPSPAPVPASVQVPAPAVSAVPSPSAPPVQTPQPSVQPPTVAPETKPAASGVTTQATTPPLVQTTQVASPAPINSFLIGGVLVGLVLIVTLLFVMRRRR
jgi:hypothetical protein